MWAGVALAPYATSRVIEVRPLPPESDVPGYRRHRAEFRTSQGVRVLLVLTPETMSPLTDDWLLPPALLLGMRHGEDVRLHGRISPKPP